MNITRRKFLATAAGVGATVALAGCAEDVSVEEATEASDVYADVNLDYSDGEMVLTVVFEENPQGSYSVCNYNPALGTTTCTPHSTPAYPHRTELELPSGEVRQPEMEKDGTQRATWVFTDEFNNFETGEYVVKTPLGRSGPASISFDVEADRGAYRIAEGTTDISE